MTSLTDPGAVAALTSRLEKLHPQRPRAWGTMTPNEMVCHLTDAFNVCLGERQSSTDITFASRTVIKWIALHTSLAWPKGSPTRPESDQKIGGTKAIDFAQDRARAIAVLRKFADPSAQFAEHPFFGPLTREEWMTWGYRHVDHHLRQFAL